MNILEKIKQAVEICMPDLRHYYRMTKKARVVNTYASDGKYYCDVQPLRTDESVDSKEPIVPKVAIPVLWGANNRGVICPPTIGVLCDLSYYDGDPNYPFISNIRYDSSHLAPKAELNEFVIQLENGVEIRIDAEKNIIALTSSNWKVDAGKSAFITVQENATINASGDVTVSAGGNADISANAVITISAPQINQNGNVSSSGMGGASGVVTENANRTQNGDIVLNGNITVSGSISASSASISGDVYAGSRSGGVI